MQARFQVIQVQFLRDGASPIFSVIHNEMDLVNQKVKKLFHNN